MTPLIAIQEALESDKPDERLEVLNQEGLFSKHLPDIQAMVGFGGEDTGMKDLWAHTKQVVLQTIHSPREHLRWAALFHDVGKVPTFSRATGKIAFHGHEALGARLFDRAARRIGMADDDRKAVHFLIAHLGLVEAYEREWTDSAVRRLHRDVGDRLEDLLNLSRSDITTKHDFKRKAHHDRINELSERARKLAELDAIPQALPKGLGTAIVAALGIAEGPELGRIMKRLKADVEAGKLPRNADIQVYLDAL